MKVKKNINHTPNPLNSASDIQINETEHNEALEYSEYLENDKLWDILSESSTKKPTESFSQSIIAQLETSKNQLPPADNIITISKWNHNKTWLSLATAAACILAVFSYNTRESNNGAVAKQHIDSNSQAETTQVIKNTSEEYTPNPETILTEDYLVALFENEDQIKDDEIYALLSF